MYLDSNDFQTIWNLAHNWTGYDPESTDPQALPQELKDSIHRIMAAVFRSDLPARTKKLIIFEDESFFTFVFDFRHLLRFRKCLRNDIFDKHYLNSIYVRRPDVLAWCEKERIDPPPIWSKQPSEAPTVKPSINNRPKDEETDRLLCQAIARTYWEIDPQIHPAHMAKAKAILLYGNGKQYKDPDTIKKWIAEVDPQKDQRKIGRPVEVPYLIDLETGSLRQN